MKVVLRYEEVRSDFKDILKIWLTLKMVHGIMGVVKGDEY